MTDNELLLAISDIIDTKQKSLVQAIDVGLQSMADEFQHEYHQLQLEIQKIRLDIENDIKPQIKTLAEHYLPAADDFTAARMSIEDIQEDIKLMKKVLSEHSEKLKKIS